MDLLTSYCLQFNFRLHLSKYYDDDHKNNDDNDNHDHDDDVNNDDIDDDSSPISWFFRVVMYTLVTDVINNGW